MIKVVLQVPVAGYIRKVHISLQHDMTVVGTWETGSRTDKPKRRKPVPKIYVDPHAISTDPRLLKQVDRTLLRSLGVALRHIKPPHTTSYFAANLKVKTLDNRLMIELGSLEKLVARADLKAAVLDIPGLGPSAYEALTGVVPNLRRLLTL